MSRTRHHGDKAKRHLFEGVPFHWTWRDRTDERRAKPLVKRRNFNWHWMKTPGWWVHDMMTVPQRAEVRELLGRVMRLSDLEDAPEFPLAKKPHDYYW